LLNDEKIKARTKKVSFTDNQTSSQQFPCSVTPKYTIGIILRRQLNGHKGTKRGQNLSASAEIFSDSKKIIIAVLVAVAH